MKLLLKKIRKFAESKGFIFLQRISFPNNNPFNLMGYILDHFKKYTADFTIVQIGANNGKSKDDDAYDYVQRNQVKLYAVEPIPSAFESLKKNYSNFSNVTCINAAVWHKDGQAKIYVINKQDDEGTKWSRYSSFSKEVITKVKKTNPGIEIIQISVAAYTLKTLVFKYQIKHIDYLQIDAEGFDFEIIKMAFSANIFPAVLRFEHSHLSYKAKVECVNLLARYGYKYISQGRDVIAIKQGLL